jgi:phosphonate transport system substrate-binding protein
VRPTGGSKTKFFKLLICGLTVLITFLAAGPVGAGKPLVLQVHPYLPAAEIITRFTPLAEYLSRSIGRPVVVRISVDYRQHIDLIGKDKADIAFMGPASYVSMADLYGNKPLLARLEIDGKPTFKGAIIVSRGSSLRSLSQLKGKRFAFGDPNSTMSHLVPRYMLWKAGVDIKDLAGHTFLKNHHNVVLGVLVGKFDAGAVKSEVFFEYEQRGLRVLEWSPEFSEHLFITSSVLPKETVLEIGNALYRLRDSEEGRKILKGVNEQATGMVSVKGSDYDNLRTILRELKKLGVEP